MKYYRINESADTKIIGRVYPQVSNGIYPTSYDSLNSINKLFYEDTINSKTEIPTGTLNKSSKQTDLLSVSFFSGQKLISEKLKSILERYVIKGIQILNTSLLINNVADRGFYILHPHISDYSFLDVKKTEFVFKDIFLKEIKSSIKFDTIEEYFYALRKNNKEAIGISFPTTYTPLVTNNIVINENCGIDFFSITKTLNGIGYFVSERLKNTIEEAKCTGVVFSELNEKYS